MSSHHYPATIPIKFWQKLSYKGINKLSIQLQPVLNAHQGQITTWKKWIKEDKTSDKTEKKEREWYSSLKMEAWPN